MKRAFFRAVLSVCSLVACSGPAQVTVQAQAAGGQLAYGAPVLTAARRNFFAGDDEGQRDGGDSGSGVLGSQHPVDLQGLPPSATALALTGQHDLGGGIQLRTTATLGYQHLRGTLPQGLGILTDPLQIDVWAQTVGAQMTLGRASPLPYGLHVDYAAGLGVTRLQAATRLQSDLLDVRARSLQILPYMLAEGRVAGKTGPALLGSLYVFPAATELRFGLEQAF